MCVAVLESNWALAFFQGSVALNGVITLCVVRVHHWPTMPDEKIGSVRLMGRSVVNY
jgi:hypothetical protein